jgi:hypothetical protein
MRSFSAELLWEFWSFLAGEILHLSLQTLQLYNTWESNSVYLSYPSGPVRKTYLSYRPARLHRLTESIPQNRFLGSINVYKYVEAKYMNIQFR